MIKITKENVSNPYFKEIGSVIWNYPSHAINPSKIEDEFVKCKRSIAYRVVNIHKGRNVLNLISVEDTCGSGKTYFNIILDDVTNGFWWYDESNDIFSQMEKLMDNLLCELPSKSKTNENTIF